MISVDWTLLLQFFNFAILLFVLNKILYKPLQKIMAERHARIEGGHKKAQDLAADIDAKMQAYQDQLDQAKTTANAERAALKKAATEQEAQVLAEAHEQAGKQLLVIKEKVAEEANQAKKILNENAQFLAEDIATKILGRKVA